MANLVELYDLVIQAQALNGVPLSHGHVYVYALGRTKLMDTWSDIDGESLNPNPVILDNAGQAHIYVSDDFDYTLVFTDEFDNEIFSVDKYLLSKGEHSHADVAVAPSEHIGVSSYHVGEVTVYVPYLTGEVGKVYEGIDPIVVNNDVNRISANHIPLGVQDPLYFVEDSETACIIGCSAQTEIPSELSGKWDEASDAVIANSAQWAEGTEYEAGSYVDIDGHTISVTGLQPEGDYAYNSALSSKLDVTALPQDLVHSGDLTAYQPAGNYLSATDSANFYPIDNPSGFITGVDLTDYATTAQLDEKLDKSDSGNFYPMEGNPSGFLTAHQSLQGYATEQWVEDKGYLTSVDIPESATWNATTQTVSANSAQWAGGTANPQIPVTGINGIKISESADQVVFEVSGDYATNDDLTGKQDSLTFGYKDTAISSIDESAIYDNSAHARINTLAGRISDLSSNKLDTTAFSDVSGTFLTAHQSLAGYATENWVTSQGYLTAETDWSDTITAASANAYNEATAAIPTGLATEDWVTAQGYLTAHQDLSDYQTTADMANYQTTAGMTAYQEAGDYLTTADSANFLTAIPDTYLQNTDLSTTDGKVTAISGIPLSAGGDVPEGVMVESGLEYNAVNEISGYNGSAIAQYGAEKQWLVHDDTLVHASNSAQYALGVNVSAVQTLMGLDETVLFSGNCSSGQSFTAVEPVSAFDRYKIYLRNTERKQQTVIEKYIDTANTGYANNWVTLDCFQAGGNGEFFTINCGKGIWDNTFTVFSYDGGYAAWMGYNLAWHQITNTNSLPVIQKVIGIGRKEV